MARPEYLESRILVSSNASWLGEGLDIGLEAGTFWMETPGPNLRFRDVTSEKLCVVLLHVSEKLFWCFKTWARGNLEKAAYPERAQACQAWEVKKKNQQTITKQTNLGGGRTCVILGEAGLNPPNT